jgi:hypothetical protein
MQKKYIITAAALIALAFILIISIVLRYTGAADVSTSAEIQNTAPTVDTIRFSTSAYGADDLTTSGILPNIGTDRTIHINGQITDLNGENDIASSTLALTFYRASKGVSCTVDKNDCYSITTCATTYTDGDDTQITYNCEVPLAYWIDGTDSSSIYESDSWAARIVISDTAGLQAANVATIEMNSLLALNLPDDIDYGTRSLAEVSSSTTNVETVLTQRGNTKADVEVLGTTMSCSALGTLPIDAQAWSLTDTDYASGAALTGSFVPTLRNINLRTDDTNELAASLYWNIAIPSTGVKGTCSGSNTIVIVAQTSNVANGNNWISRTSAADNTWTSVAYGNGLFVAVANTGTGNRVMTSPDGITWTSQSAASDDLWRSVTYANGLFVAVGESGTGNRVMTSPDGITWTSRASAVDNEWSSVTYGNGLFVAVAETGVGNRVMTSPDGITWTSRSSAVDVTWSSVTYGNGLFVAVAQLGTGDRVMTSPDGITWTSHAAAANDRWASVTYGNGLYVAVSYIGTTGSRVMTSPDGTTWTLATSAADNAWRGVTYANGLFVAVSTSGTGNRVMTSPDGTTWTSQASAAENGWLSVTYGNGIFVAVSGTGTGDRVMTSD